MSDGYDTPEEKISPLAALISTVASGEGTQADHDRLVLKLIAEAQARGATWEQLARILDYPNGQACKKAARKLEADVRAAELAAGTGDA